MDELLPLAKKVGEKLKARKETVGISESSAGGLISAVLLAIPGASAYFMGGAVVYTRPAGEAFLGATPSRRSGIRSSSERRHAVAPLGHPLVVGALGAARGRTGARPTEDDLGPRGNRRLGTDRQFLRRSSRPYLRRRCRSQRQGGAHAAYRVERSRRQHAAVRGGSAETSRRAAAVNYRCTR